MTEATTTLTRAGSTKQTLKFMGLPMELEPAAQFAFRATRKARPGDRKGMTESFMTIGYSA